MGTQNTGKTKQIINCFEYIIHWKVTIVTALHPICKTVAKKPSTLYTEIHCTLMGKIVNIYEYTIGVCILHHSIHSDYNHMAREYNGFLMLTTKKCFSLLVLSFVVLIENHFTQISGKHISISTGANIPVRPLLSTFHN